MEYSTKLLIADENPAARKALKDGLIAAGYRNIVCQKDLAGLPRVVMGQK